MPNWNPVLICVVLFIILILIEFVVRRHIWRLLFQLLLVGAISVLTLMLNNSATGKLSMGDAGSPTRVLLLMFVATICGIAARYVFYLNRGSFSFLDLFKPIVISPIVLMPLIGSVQSSGGLSPIQIVSFCVLAFQNGFFWQAVLEGAKPNSHAKSGE